MDIITFFVVIRYNSYNQDYGLDVYEEDFINDFIADDEVTYTTPKSQKRLEKRSLTLLRKSSSDSSDSDVGTPTKNVQKRRLLSSDEDAAVRARPEGAGSVVGGARAKPACAGDSSDQDEVLVRRATRKRHSSNCARLSSSSEEEEEGGDAGRDRKSRKVRKWESDEELE